MRERLTTLTVVLAASFCSLVLLAPPATAEGPGPEAAAKPGVEAADRSETAAGPATKASGPSTESGAPTPASTADATRPAPNPDTPVVLVILDELPLASLMKDDLTIDARRFPNFGRLASRSTWYRDHASAGDFTAWAVPPILTGNHSNLRTLPTNGAQPNNIFNLIGPGRRVHALEDVTELCSKRFCPNGGQGNHSSIVLANEFIKAKFDAVDVPAINRWIKGIPAGERAFSMIHIPLPHQPQRFLPEGQTYPGGPLGFTIPKNRNGWTITDAGTSLVQQRHLLQTGFTDRLLGRIMNRIQRNGDWDRSLVIVTADHGFSFDPRYDRRDVWPSNIAATVNPPLFIKYPGQTEGLVSTSSTQAIDLVPTIAGILGIEDRYATEGVPVDQVPEGRRMTINKHLMAKLHITADDIRNQRPALLETSRRRFGTGGLWKLGPRPELIGSKPGRARRLGRASVTIDKATRLAKVRPGSGTVPSFVTGIVRGVSADQVLAIAVNGRVTGTTRTFRYSGALRFGSMVPPSAFRRGANRVAVYAVTGSGSLRTIKQ